MDLLRDTPMCNLLAPMRVFCWHVVGWLLIMIGLTASQLSNELKI